MNIPQSLDSWISKPVNLTIIILFLFGLVFKLGDIFSTLYLVSLYGTEGEANSWIRYLMESQSISFGLTISFIQAMFCYICALWIFRNNIRYQIYFCSIFLLLHIYIVYHNMSIINQVI